MWFSVLSADKKVKDISEHTAACPVELGVFTSLTYNSCKFFILYVQKFTESASGGADLIELILTAAAFRADEFQFFHFYSF